MKFVWLSTWSYSGSAGMEMKVMTMKMPAIRATLLDGGSPGRSSGARSVCSGGAESVITGSLRVDRRGPLRVDVPKAGQEWEPQGLPAASCGETPGDHTPVGRPSHLGDLVPEGDQALLHREPGAQGKHAARVLGPVAVASLEPFVAGERRAVGGRLLPRERADGVVVGELAEEELQQAGVAQLDLAGLRLVRARRRAPAGRPG